MTLPLYMAVAQDPPNRSAEGHAGLWYDKFCNQWHVNGFEWTMRSDEQNRKLGWIQCLTKGKVGASGQIEEYASRLKRLVKRRGGRL